MVFANLINFNLKANFYQKKHVCFAIQFLNIVLKQCLILYNPDMKDFLYLIGRYYSQTVGDYSAIHL